MWKQLQLTNLLLRFVLILVLSGYYFNTVGALSDKRLCADQLCKETISLGRGKINYRAGEEGMVSFKINSKIRIKSKSAGNNPSLWGIEVDNEEGYAPKEYILETDILKRDKELKFILDVEQKSTNQILAPSEKLLIEENAGEATTTSPLDFTSKKSTANLLKDEAIENFGNKHTSLATPVQSEIVDGTEIPIYINNEDAKNENFELKKLPNNEYVGSNNKDGQKAIDSLEKANTDSEVNKEENYVIKLENESYREDNHNANLVEIEESNNGEDLEIQEVSNDEQIQLDAIETKEFYKKPVIFSESSEKGTKRTEEFKNVENVDIPDGTKTKELFEEAANFTQGSQEEIKHTKVALNTSNDIVSKSRQTEELFVKQDTFSGTSEMDTKYKPTDKNVQNTDEGDTKYSMYTIQNEYSEAKILAQKRDTSKEISTKDETEYEAGNESILDVGGVQKTVVKKELLHDDDHEVQLENGIHIININDNFPADDHNIHNVNDIILPEITNTLQNEDKVHSDSLDEIMAGSQINVSLKYEEIYTANNSIYQQDVAEDITSNVESRIKQNQIDKETEDETLNSFIKKTEKVSFYKQNIVAESVTTESSLGNPTQIEDISKTVHDPSVDESSVKVTHIENQKHISTENNIDVEKASKSDTPKIAEVDNSISDFDTNDNTLKYTHFISSQESQVDKTIEIDKTIVTEFATGLYSDKNVEATTEEAVEATLADIPKKEQSLEKIASESNPTTYNSNSDVHLNIALPTQADHSYRERTNDISLANDIHSHSENSQEDLISSSKQTDGKYNGVPTTYSDTISQSVQPKTEPEAQSPSNFAELEVKESTGLFATIMSTVNNMLSNNKKNKRNEIGDRELEKILFSTNDNNPHKTKALSEGDSFLYCKNIEPNGDCPDVGEEFGASTSQYRHTDLTLDTFFKSLAARMLEMSELIVFLIIAATTTLFFFFGYYCFCNSSREGALLSKLNQLESSLIASHKENSILKHNLMSTRQKLASTEDNSFGSNDVLVSLKKELEEEIMEKATLQQQVTVLQKELENAAEAGIELNKMVSELLNNQTGDESIISSVEELQKQLNEQQNTIFEINASLAEKSRENSDLQLCITEQMNRIYVMENGFKDNASPVLEGKNKEIETLRNKIIDLTEELENDHIIFQTNVAKIKALEECLEKFTKDPDFNNTELIDSRYQLTEIKYKYKFLDEKYRTELDSRKFAANQLEIALEELEKLKQVSNQSEKDKLEAQTRLEVLSNYFKDKENQLQNELLLKEALWLKEQGETTATVDRLTAMQKEIQSLKSQNDSLRAEIEVQGKSHRAIALMLDKKMVENYIDVRQSNRRYEDARAECSVLRRKLTAFAEAFANEFNKQSTVLMESPESPMLRRMPPPPFFLPPFVDPPPSCMGMPPPPPFGPPGEIRPAPLGRIMSPPPQHSGRFSPYQSPYSITSSDIPIFF